MNREYVLVKYKNGNSSSCYRCDKDDNCPDDGQCVIHGAIWKEYYKGIEEDFIIIDIKSKNLGALKNV